MEHKVLCLFHKCLVYIEVYIDIYIPVSLGGQNFDIYIPVSLGSQNFGTFYARKLKFCMLLT